jgi:hypothetical protein
VHGRELAGTGSHIYPNILDGDYLAQIERLESDIAETVAVPMRREWRQAMIREAALAEREDDNKLNKWKLNATNFGQLIHFNVSKEIFQILL